MLELYTPDYEILNTKDRITIDLIKDGEEFLKQFDIDQDFLLDTVSLVYRYLRTKEKIPHNLCSDMHFMMYCPKEHDHESWTGYKHLFLVSQLDKEV